jgi:hypothetical protein
MVLPVRIRVKTIVFLQSLDDLQFKYIIINIPDPKLRLKLDSNPEPKKKLFRIHNTAEIYMKRMALE